MRHMEILKLKKEDIDFNLKVIKIKEAKAGAREQPISIELAEFLKKYMQWHKGEYLFPSPISSTGHLKEIRKPFARVIKQADVD